MYVILTEARRTDGCERPILDSEFGVLRASSVEDSTTEQLQLPIYGYEVLMHDRNDFGEFMGPNNPPSEGR